MIQKSSDYGTFPTKIKLQIDSEKYILCSDSKKLRLQSDFNKLQKLKLRNAQKKSDKIKITERLKKKS